MSVLSNESTGGRLADFFVVVGLPNDFTLSSLMRLGRVSEAAEREILKASRGGPAYKPPLGTPVEACIFNPAVTDMYGSEYPPLPEGVELFSFPEGISFLRNSPLPSFHSFVHTSESGARLYGSCLTFYEKITPTQIERVKEICGECVYATDFRGVHVPRCLCIISSWAYIDSFRAVLCDLYRLSIVPCDLPIERYICNIIDDIPSPLARHANISLTICSSDISFLCPPLNQPTRWAGVPMKPFLECLDPEKVIHVFTAALCERQILFVSSQYTLLTSAAESITSLMYPFAWKHVYIPLLPVKLVGVLQATVPFIVGIHASFMTHPDTNIGLETVVVYLDENHIDFGNLGPPPKLNSHRFQKLMKAIQEFGGAFAYRGEEWSALTLPHFDDAFVQPLLPMHSNGDEQIFSISESKLRESFLNLFVSVFTEYRSFLIRGQKYKKFRKKEFIATQPSDSREFFDTFLESQAFAQFVDERFLVDTSDPDVAFFEESLIAKVNRCKRRSMTIFRGQKATPFLDDLSLQQVPTHIPPRPDPANLEEFKENFHYDVFPKLNPRLFSPSRCSYVSPEEILTLASRHLPLPRHAPNDRVKSTQRTAASPASVDITSSSHNSPAESIRSSFLILLSQYARYQGIKSGKRKGTFKSTAQVINNPFRYGHADSLGDSTSDGSAPHTSPSFVRGTIMLILPDIDGGPIVLPPTAEQILHDEEQVFTFENWCFFDTDSTVEIGIIVLKEIAKAKEYVDDLSLRLMADACSFCSKYVSALSLVLVMEQMGVSVDNKIAAKISSSFASADQDEISFMSPVDIMEVGSWQKFKDTVVGSLLLTTSASKALRSLDTEHFIPDLVAGDWIGFDSYLSTPDAATLSPRWRRRRVPSADKNILPLLQWSDELLCQLLPGISIDLKNPAGTSCDSITCGRSLTLEELDRGWNIDPNHYKVRCIHCGNEFSPRFSVLCDNMDKLMQHDDADRILWIDLMSPWVLGKEMKNILTVDGISTFVSPSFRVTRPGMFWNIVIAFRRVGLPYAFLLQKSFRKSVPATIFTSHA